jgi:hypothetical protein
MMSVVDACRRAACRREFSGTEIIVRYLARLQRDAKQNDGLFLYGQDAETSTEVCAQRMQPRCL